jgi:hypothetical protein
MLGAKTQNVEFANKRLPFLKQMMKRTVRTIVALLASAFVFGVFPKDQTSFLGPLLFICICIYLVGDLVKWSVQLWHTMKSNSSAWYKLTCKQCGYSWELNQPRHQAAEENPKIE